MNTASMIAETRTVAEDRERIRKQNETILILKSELYQALNHIHNRDEEVRAHSEESKRLGRMCRLLWACVVLLIGAILVLGFKQGLV